MTQAEIPVSPPALETPADIMRRFAQLVEERDVEKLVALYAPDGVFSPEPNVVVKGHEGLRAAFRELLSIQPSLHVVPAQIHEGGDLALVANDWSLSGMAPDGTPIQRSGRSAVVLRRSEAGNWLIAIDRP